jgi:hypothetical protein
MSGEALPPASGPEFASPPIGAQVAGPQVGADEWVARQAQRREYLPSWLGTAQRATERVGWWPRLGIAAVAGALLPVLGLGGFQLQVGIDALVIAVLAVGLNIVVGSATSRSSVSGHTGMRCSRPARSERTGSTCRRSSRYRW